MKFNKKLIDNIQVSVFSIIVARTIWVPCIALFFLFPLSVFAQEPIILQDDPGRYSLDGRFSYLEDPTGELTVEEVTGLALKDSFAAAEGEALHLGVTDSAYWLRFTVRNDSTGFTSWILQAEFIWHTLLELHISDGSGGFTVERTGHKMPLHKQDIKHSKLLFDFPVDRGEEKTLYLRVESNESMILDFTILSYNRFIAADHENQLLYGLFYGVLIIMFLYNIVYHIFSRERAFVYYAFWVLFLILHQLQANGLYYEYLAPFVRSWLSFDPYYIIRGFIALFSILFVRSFLDTRKYTPVLHKVTYGFLGFSALFLFIEFIIPAWIVDQMLVYYSIILSALGIFLGIAVHIRGNPIAKFLVIGLGVPILGIVISTLSASGVIRFSPLFLNMDQFGNMFTVVFFSFILGYRYRLLRQDKEIAERVNEEQTAFFINLSHEIKTPLTLILGYLQEYIRRSGRDPDLEVVERNIAKLHRDMINFFDVLKFRKGKLVYEHDRVINLSRYLEQTAALFGSPAAARNIIIRVDTEPGLFIKADPFALERVLNNLLDNAVKFNRDGGSIDATLKGRYGTLFLSISSTGAGIPPEDLSSVFEPYFQLSKKERPAEGIGIGLAIVR